MSRVLMSARERIIIPLDFPNPDNAKAVIGTLAGQVGAFKIGRVAIDGGFGHDMAGYAIEDGQLVFWDNKMSDIPNTSGEAMKSTKKRLALGLWATNIHANSGHDSIKAMVEEAGATSVWAVTLLTSITADQCEELFGAPPEIIVRRWAGIALRQGVHGIICSPQEVKMLRKEYGDDFELVTPGVRPAGSDTQDQARVDTPGNAVVNGADYTVIGRPITGAPDPVAAAKAIAQEIEEALSKPIQ